MAIKRPFLLCAAASLALVETGWGQPRPSSWRTYQMADGCPEPACVSVSVSPNGNVFARHLNLPFFSKLDGYNVQTLPAPAQSASALCESPGGQLWTATAQGLMEWTDGSWTLVRLPPPNDEAAVRSTLSPAPRLLQIYPVRQGRVLLLFDDRLAEFNSEDPDRPETRIVRAASDTRLGPFTGICAARDRSLWISGSNGLARFPGPIRSIDADAEVREYPTPDSLSVRNLRYPQESRSGRITCIADSLPDGRTPIVEWDGERWFVAARVPQTLIRAWRGPDDTLWAISRTSLLQFDPDRGEMTDNEDISARRFYDAAVAGDGTFWLATSDGLFHYTPPSWRNAPAMRHFTAAAHCLSPHSSGQLWFITGNQLHLLKEDTNQTFALPAPVAQNPQAVTALIHLGDDTLLLFTDTELFRFEPATARFTLLRRTEHNETLNRLGVLPDGPVCFQQLAAGGTAPESPWQIYDGTRFGPFPYPMPGPACSGEVTAFYAARNGDLWISNDRAVAQFSKREWHVFGATDETVPHHAIGFVETADGRIWCATAEEIWQYDGRSWLMVKAGFNHINALLRTADDSLWVASNSGVTRYSQGAWIENGPDAGLATPAVRELCEDSLGRLWAGTARGVSAYHPEADPDPPQVTMDTPRGPSVPEGGVVTLSFHGRDKWKFTPYRRLLYSYRLDERDWSPPTEDSTVSFAALSAGKHYFQVRAIDAHGNTTPEPAREVLVVVPPWYREARLVLISFLGLVAVLLFAGLAFNRHRRLVRSYAEVERKVAERTRELEIANRELLHSQKMNALGTLAAGVAHDFNNILSIIKGSAQIIESNPDNPEKIRTRVDRIKTVVEQGSGIVKAMLGFSRDSDGAAAPCDINAVVSDTITLLGDRFLREVETRTACAPDLPEVTVNRDFIQQILINFIFNAAESMSGRKRVILSTRFLNALPPTIVLPPARAPAYVAIAVQDFGCGVPPRNLPRIFEPFFTTKALSTRRGTGLGLSMVYELAKKMEAGLAVESVVGEGSTFVLILPAGVPAPKVQTTMPDSSPAAHI